MKLYAVNICKRGTSKDVPISQGSFLCHIGEGFPNMFNVLSILGKALCGSCFRKTTKQQKQQYASILLGFYTLISFPNCL